MNGLIKQYLTGVADPGARAALFQIFESVGRAASCVALASAGLVIKAGGGVLAKTGATAYYAIVNGRIVTIAASTDMPALTGLNITANRFNVACFFINAAGTVSVLFGTEGASIGAVKWPDFPVDRALVGILLITHSSTFTGNTTPLDTATTVYLSPVGSVDPGLIF